MSAELLVRLPDDISDETAAAGLLKGVSASFLLHDVHPVRAGQMVLVHAAAGGVGQLLVQWARELGATVIATVSSDDKARIAERLGADHVVIYTRENFADAVMRITAGRGADVIYDAVGADTFARFAGSAGDARPPRQLRPGVGSGRQLGHRPLRLEIGDGVAAELRPLHRHARKAACRMSSASSACCASAG